VIKTRLYRLVEGAVLALVAASGVIGGYIASGIGEKVSAIIFGAVAAALFSACGTLAWKALDAFRDATAAADPLDDFQRSQVRRQLRRERVSVVGSLVLTVFLAATAGACWVFVRETDVRTRDAFIAVYFGFASASLLLPLLFSIALSYFSADDFVSRIRDSVREQREAAQHLSALADERKNFDVLAVDPALSRYREPVAH
jgi:MFS family permease